MNDIINVLIIFHLHLFPHKPIGDDGFGDPHPMDDDVTDTQSVLRSTGAAHDGDFGRDSLFDAGETPRPSTSHEMILRGGKTPLYKTPGGQMSDRFSEAHEGGDDGFGGNIGGSEDLLSGGLFEGGGLFEDGPALDVTAQTSKPGSRKVSKFINEIVHGKQCLGNCPKKCVA